MRDMPHGLNVDAKIAQLVEHDLAKVGVAGSSPVFRSLHKSRILSGFFYCPMGDGGVSIYQAYYR